MERISPVSASMEKLPLLSVTVPFFVLFTATLTPPSGSPSSEYTRPVAGGFCGSVKCKYRADSGADGCFRESTIVFFFESVSNWFVFEDQLRNSCNSICYGKVKRCLILPTGLPCRPPGNLFVFLLLRKLF